MKSSLSQSTPLKPTKPAPSPASSLSSSSSSSSTAKSTKRSSSKLDSIPPQTLEQKYQHAISGIRFCHRNSPSDVARRVLQITDGLSTDPQVKIAEAFAEVKHCLFPIMLQCRAMIDYMTTSDRDKSAATNDLRQREHQALEDKNTPRYACHVQHKAYCQGMKRALDAHLTVKDPILAAILSSKLCVTPSSSSSSATSSSTFYTQASKVDTVVAQILVTDNETICQDDTIIEDEEADHQSHYLDYSIDDAAE